MMKIERMLKWLLLFLLSLVPLWAAEIHQAAGKGDLAAIKKLIEAEPKLVSAKDDGGASPLHFAAAGAHNEVIAFLLSKGADPNAATLYGFTPLHYSIMRGHLETSKLLVSRGVDINYKNFWGYTPLHLAARSGLVDEIRLLIRNRALLNVKDSKNETPLHFASRQGKKEVVELLIESGAAVNARDLGGHTPLFKAAAKNHPDIVELLVQKGAEVDARNKYGRTVLHQAAVNGNLQIASYVVARGARINLRDYNGHTALYYAGCYGQRKLSEFLQTKGAGTEKSMENFGFSPLLKRELKEKEAIVWYLGHSGWAIKTRNHFLIFDYWEDGGVPAEPLLANGHINPSEIKDLKVYVFATHEHGDHFDKKILQWREPVKDITYIFGWKTKDDAGHIRLGPRNRKKVGDVEIACINSPQAGDIEGTFLVKVDGLSIYHSGDYCRGHDIYKGDIDYLAGIAAGLDLAFLPAGHRQYYEGAFYLIEKIRPSVMFPMHAGGFEYNLEEFARESGKKPYDTRLVRVGDRGDHFLYSGGQIKAL